MCVCLIYSNSHLSVIVSTTKVSLLDPAKPRPPFLPLSVVCCLHELLPPSLFPFFGQEKLPPCIIILILQHCCFDRHIKKGLVFTHNDRQSLKTDASLKALILRHRADSLNQAHVYVPSNFWTHKQRIAAANSYRTHALKEKPDVYRWQTHSGAPLGHGKA